MDVDREGIADVGHMLGKPDSLEGAAGLHSSLDLDRLKEHTSHLEGAFHTHMVACQDSSASVGSIPATETGREYASANAVQSWERQREDLVTDCWYCLLAAEAV